MNNSTNNLPGISRRNFVLGAAATALAANTAGLRAASAAGPVILTSWDFGPGANSVGWPILAGGGLAIDAGVVRVGPAQTLAIAINNQQIP